GRVCDVASDLQTTSAVCRQVGWGEAAPALSSAYLGTGAGPSWLDSVGCSGRVQCLLQDKLEISTVRVQVLCWPKDCSEIPTGSSSGIYIIQPAGFHQLVVYCEMNVTDGGWTVIQRNRHDTEITWAESWSTYKYGFGNVQSDFWLGTEYIYQIAKHKVYQVKFVIQDATGSTKFADYNLFSLEDESHGYRLRLGSYTGTAGDAMTSDNPKNVHNSMKFSAKDRDQDTYRGNCAYSYEGGWWYSACYSVRLNFKGGLTWGSLCNGNCKSSLILIRPAPYH
ncbi:FGL1L protein, partial [Nothoprocta pentlandii]|nr:FGL1L protein [Nothoprocta pentlandii]